MSILFGVIALVSAIFGTKCVTEKSYESIKFGFLYWIFFTLAICLVVTAQSYDTKKAISKTYSINEDCLKIEEYDKEGNLIKIIYEFDNGVTFIEEIEK